MRCAHVRRLALLSACYFEMLSWDTHSLFYRFIFFHVRPSRSWPSFEKAVRSKTMFSRSWETTVFTLGVSTYPAGKLSQLRIDHKTNFSFLCPTSLYWLKTTVPHPEQAMASMDAKSTQRDIIVPQGQPLPLGMTPPRPPSTEARRMKIWASGSLNGISELEHAPNALHSPESGHGTRKKDISSLDAGCWMWIDRMREKSQLMSWDLRWNIFISMDLLIRVGPVTLVRAFR